MRALRTGLGWTQEKLGNESGVNAATINQIERGRRSPKVATLERLAAAMGAEVADFFPKAQSALFMAVDPLPSREPALAAADLTSAAVAVPASAITEADEEARHAALGVSEFDPDSLRAYVRECEEEYEAATEGAALDAARKRYSLALAVLVQEGAVDGRVETISRQALMKALRAGERRAG